MRIYIIARPAAMHRDAAAALRVRERSDACGVSIIDAAALTADDAVSYIPKFERRSPLERARPREISLQAPVRAECLWRARALQCWVIRSNLIEQFEFCLSNIYMYYPNCSCRRRNTVLVHVA